MCDIILSAKNALLGMASVEFVAWKMRKQEDIKGKKQWVYIVNNKNMIRK